MMQKQLVILLCAFALSVPLCAALIPLLKKLGAGQNILGYVKEHEKKGGTPTMGGLAFLFAAAAVALAAYGFRDKPFLVALAVGMGYLAVGFLDDFLKKKRARNLGLTPWQKIAFQGAVAVIASLYCCLNGLTEVYIPFTRLRFDIGWWMFPLAALVLIATVNSVNLTDGLDGLAGSVGAFYFLAFGVLLILQGGSDSLSGLCFSLTGAIAGFLVFNTNRASLFMGDTGSNALAVPVVGIMFVISSISVIVQVIYYKKTGRRVFLMAPVHHHFQEKGYTECKIAFVYSVVTAMAGAALLLPFA